MSMKKLLFLMLTLALSFPIWAGERTVTISRNEGQFEESNGVYYCYKGGLMMTFTSGLNNPNYLVEHQQVYFEIMSVNQTYIIKKVVFHCVDNTTSDNLDCFYWGPTTISVVQNFYNQSQPGTYTASGYTGTWTGETNHIQFTTMAKPVRFGSVEITYEKETGDIFDLVTSMSQIEEGEKYVIVSQRASKAMSTSEVAGLAENNIAHNTMGATSVSFVDDTKQKVIVNDEVMILTLESNPNTTSHDMRPWLFRYGTNFLRRSSATSGSNSNANNYTYGHNLFLTHYETATDKMYFPFKISLGTNHNALMSFVERGATQESDATSGTYAIRYHNGSNFFRVMNYSTNYNTYAENQRVYLYRPAQNYEITTSCDPANAGFITLGDGVLELDGHQTSQEHSTVTFFVGANEGHGLGTVTATDANSNPIQLTLTSSTTLGNNYSFVMPASDVHIHATFVDPIEIHTVCNPDGGGEFGWNSGAVDFNDQVMSNEGNVVNFTVTPAEGFSFDGVTAVNDRTGETIVLIENSDGSFTFTMPADEVTLTANFTAIEGTFVITTECLPHNANPGYVSVYGGIASPEGSTPILANSGSTVTFWVGTYMGWVINDVVIQNLTTGNPVEVQLIESLADGKRYQFVMPASNVHIQAIFKPYDKLYLLGTANGGDWAPNGPEFEYDPYNNEYYLNVYFKGIRDVSGQQDDTNGYFSLTTVVNDSDWGAIWQYRLVPDQFRVDISDGLTKNLYSVTNGYSEQNAFRIPAGVYKLTVPVDKSRITVTEIPLTLTLNETPEGVVVNENGEEITYVAYGTVVQANTELGAVVHDINPNEVSQTSLMSTDGGLNWSNGNTVTITTPGTTQVDGQAYIGYIIVENSGKYAYTPLGYIEENKDPNDPVIVCDTLVGTWAVDNGTVKQLWAKDIGNKSIDKTEIITGEDGQEDYVMDILHYQTKPWDQSNWVVIDFSNVEGDPEEFVSKAIKPLAVRGEYADAAKYRIELTSPLSDEAILPGVEYPGYPGYLGDYQEHQEIDYMYNHYVMANFMRNNQNAPYGNGFVAPSTAHPDFVGEKLFFLNPKSQEIAHVMGVWNGNDQFTVYARDSHNNAYDYSGVINVDWAYNRVGQELYGVPELVSDTAYLFHMAVELLPQSPNSFNGGKPGEASTSYKGYPLDLPAHGAIPTSVVRLVASKTVVGVSYYNVMGQESKTPHQGINIVVTRYSDGSTSTIKLMR